MFNQRSKYESLMKLKMERDGELLNQHESTRERLEAQSQSLNLQRKARQDLHRQYSEKKSDLLKKIAALKTSLEPPGGGKKAESTKMLEDLLRQCIGDLDND